MTEITTRQLTWHGETKSWSAMVSDFGYSFEFSRLYPDACDVGLTLISSNGFGQPRAMFYLANTDRRDGDVIAWELKPTPEAVRKFSRLNGTRIVLFND